MSTNTALSAIVSNFCVDESTTYDYITCVHSHTEDSSMIARHVISFLRYGCFYLGVDVGVVGYTIEDAPALAKLVYNNANSPEELKAYRDRTKPLMTARCKIAKETNNMNLWLIDNETLCIADVLFQRISFSSKSPVLPLLYSMTVLYEVLLVKQGIGDMRSFTELLEKNENPDSVKFMLMMTRNVATISAHIGHAPNAGDAVANAISSRLLYKKSDSAPSNRPVEPSAMCVPAF